jgi:hypothetical protein
MSFQETMLSFRNPAIRSFLRGSSSAGLSSGKHGWSEFALESHEVHPGELGEAAIDSYVLLLWQGSSSSRGERLNSQGSFTPYLKHPGTLTLYPPGPLPPVRLLTKSNLLLCALNTKLIRSVRERMRDEDQPRSSASRTAAPGVQLSFQECVAPKALAASSRRTTAGWILGAALRRVPRPCARSAPLFAHEYRSGKQSLC